MQRRLGLVSIQGDSTARRIALLVAITWLPSALVAIATGRAWGDEVAEPLFSHFAVHVRFLIALPLLVLAEGAAERVLPPLLDGFARSGLIPPGSEGAFAEALRATERQRDSKLGLLLVASVVVGGFLTEAEGASLHEVAWAGASLSGEPPGRALHFASSWYLYVSRPIFAGSCAIWAWRAVVLCTLFRRIARLDLALVASHPDRSAGLGFLARLPFVLLPFALAMGTAIASRLAHEIVYHGESLQALKPIVAAWAVFAAVVFITPELPLALRLGRMRRTALPRYGFLLSRLGRQLEARWLDDGARADADLATAPDFSTAADAAAVYQNVAAIQPIPSLLRSAAPFVVVALLPFLPVVAIEIPIKDLLLRILSAVA